MPNRVRTLTVREHERADLERLAHSETAPARMVMRARIVLLSAHGLSGREIAHRLGCTEPTVVAWRRRYAAHGLAGLEDAARLGGPTWVMTPDVRALVLATTMLPPDHRTWSARRLAHWLKVHHGIYVSHDSVTALWRRYGLHRDPVDGLVFHTEPALMATAHHLVGLFIDPPWNAAAIGVDTTSAPAGDGPAGPAGPVGAMHDVLTALTGHVVEGRTTEQRLVSFDAFVSALVDAQPNGPLHLVWNRSGELGDHQSPALIMHHRIQVNLTSAECSWLGVLDCFLAAMSYRTGGEAELSRMATALETHMSAGDRSKAAFLWIRSGPPGQAAEADVDRA